MIDTKNWREFRIGDLFDVLLASGDIKLDAVDTGLIPLVSSGSTNNGIVGYISEFGDGKSEMFAGNKITVDMFGTAFYQPNDFYAVSHGRVNILSPKFDMSPHVGLFVATLIQQEAFKYSYGRAVYSNEVMRMVIKLPAVVQATVDGHKYTPDWAYMEQFMRQLSHKPITTQIQSPHIPLETEKWGEFRIGDLFVLQTGKTNDTLLDDGNSAIYVGAKKDDNGVMRTCDRNPKYMQKGNCVVFICNGQGSVGYANYMPCEFCGTTDIVAGYNDHLNPFVGLFIATVVCCERPKYSWGRKWKTHLADTIIKLPVTLNGTPDWQWMENYMKSLPYSDRISNGEVVA